MKKKGVENIKEILNDATELINEVKCARYSLNDILRGINELTEFFSDFRDNIYKELSKLKKRLDIIVEINNLDAAAKSDN